MQYVFNRLINFLHKLRQTSCIDSKTVKDAEGQNVEPVIMCEETRLGSCFLLLTFVPKFSLIYHGINEIGRRFKYRPTFSYLTPKYDLDF